MRTAQSFSLHTTMDGPDKLQPQSRQAKPLKRRIRSSISAGPTMAVGYSRPEHQNYSIQPHFGDIALPQRENKQNRTTLYSRSADVSSMSSSSSGSVKERGAGDEATNAALRRILHKKHSVIRRAREQIIKLINAKMTPQEDTANPEGNQTVRSIFVGVRRGSPLETQGTNILHQQTTADYNLEVFNHLDISNNKSTLDDLCSITRQKYPCNVHNTKPDDGRNIELTKSHFTEVSVDFERKSDASPRTLQERVVNYKQKRNVNKFSLPCFVETSRTEKLQNAKDYVENTKGEEAAATDCAAVKTDESIRGLVGRSELQDSHLEGNNKNHIDVNDGDKRTEPREANLEPSLKTFYENPLLKRLSVCSVLPVVVESKVDQIITICRSTNTTPVNSVSQFTNTTSSEMSTKSTSTNISSRNTDVTAIKEITKLPAVFSRPLHVLQPFLLVLALFTVSMSGAYVGVVVGSTSCGCFAGGDFEPTFLQWLFPARRQVRAF